MLPGLLVSVGILCFLFIDASLGTSLVIWGKGQAVCFESIYVHTNQCDMLSLGPQNMVYISLFYSMIWECGVLKKICHDLGSWCILVKQKRHDASQSRVTPVKCACKNCVSTCKIKMVEIKMNWGKPAKSIHLNRPWCQL